MCRQPLFHQSYLKPSVTHDIVKHCTQFANLLAQSRLIPIPNTSIIIRERKLSHLTIKKVL